MERRALVKKDKHKGTALNQKGLLTISSF